MNKPFRFLPHHNDFISVYANFAKVVKAVELSLGNEIGLSGALSQLASGNLKGMLTSLFDTIDAETHSEVASAVIQAAAILPNISVNPLDEDGKLLFKGDNLAPLAQLAPLFQLQKRAPLDPTCVSEIVLIFYLLIVS